MLRYGGCQNSGKRAYLWSRLIAPVLQSGKLKKAKVAIDGQLVRLQDAFKENSEGFNDGFSGLVWVQKIGQLRRYVQSNTLVRRILIERLTGGTVLDKHTENILENKIILISSARAHSHRRI